MAVKRGLVAVLLLMLLSGCAIIEAMPVTKIALLAPFEGRLRDVGYDALFASRLALAEANVQHVTLLAVDDGGRPDYAADRMAALANDPAVSAIIALGPYATSEIAQIAQTHVPVLIVGYWQTPPQAETVAMLAHQEIAELVTYDALNLPDTLTGETLVGGDLLALAQIPQRYADISGITVVSSGQVPDADFIERYLASAPFAPKAGLLATLTYDAIGIVLQTITTDTLLGAIRYDGLNGRITFRESFWHDAPLYRYQFNDEGRLIAAVP